MTQTALFVETLKTETRAFDSAVAARNAHDYFTAEYAAAQAVVDAHYARVQTLQSVVPWRQWP